MSAFKWWFKQPTITGLCDALAAGIQYPGGCGFEVHPENADGSPLTDEQVKMLGGLSLKLHVIPAPKSTVLNDSFPCPPICSD